MIINLKTDYVQLWFLYKSDYRICSALPSLNGGSLKITFTVPLRKKNE